MIRHASKSSSRWQSLVWSASSSGWRPLGFAYHKAASDRTCTRDSSSINRVHFAWPSYCCVIMSTVRTASEALPFVKDLRRSNVSLTRAKVAFFFIGHYEAVCSRAHKSKSYEIRRANEAWYWLGTELSKRHQVFDCDIHTLGNLITTPMETQNVNTTQPTTTSKRGLPEGVQQHTPSMLVDGRVLYDMKRVRSDQQVTCACEACTPFGSKEPYSLDDICDADLRERGPDGRHGMVAALSYRLHFLCNSNPTPLDLWKIWQRSGTSQGDPQHGNVSSLTIPKVYWKQ